MLTRFYLPRMGTLSFVFCLHVYVSHYSQTEWMMKTNLDCNCCFCKRIKQKIICNPDLIFRLTEHRHPDLVYGHKSMTLHFVPPFSLALQSQCLPFYIINEVGHLTTSVDHLGEFCQNYHLAAICTQLMVKFFLQLRFIQYFDCKIPDFSRIDSHFVA